MKRNVSVACAGWNITRIIQSQSLLKSWSFICSLLTAFITPFGRHKWSRLPFGLNIPSEVFHKRLCQALERLPGVLCIADDIIIHGKYDQEHDENLEKFLERFCKKGIKLKKEKLEIRCSQIAFHGHILTSKGLKIGSWYSQSNSENAKTSES